MSDSTHALAVTAIGLVMTALGLLMAWHCRRSARRGELQMSAGCVVERQQNPISFCFALASFAVLALALTLAGAYFLGEGLSRL
jgi:hypothetical protein